MTDAAPAIEAQIADLERQLQAKRAEAGTDASAPYERAEVHAVVGEQIQQTAPVSGGTPTPATTTQPATTPSWSDPALAATVQNLVNIAFSQGIGAAVAEASKTGNAALVDALHDVLADQLYEELRTRNKLQAPPEGT